MSFAANDIFNRSFAVTFKLEDQDTPFWFVSSLLSDGENALRQLREKKYDVIFCDWKMPGLNGRQIYEKLRAVNPGRCRRVVFFSGDVVNEQMRGFLEQEKRPCLAKPFTFDDIHAAIKTILMA